MSITTNLGLNKHDNVDSNENEFDIENYLNANWDKIDEKIGQQDTAMSTMQDNIEAEIGTKVSQNLETYSGDLNDVKTTGFLYTASNTTNIPVSGHYFYVTTIVRTENNIYQKAIRLIADLNIMYTYERQCVSGTWTEWNCIVAGNGTEKYTGSLDDINRTCTLCGAPATAYPSGAGNGWGYIVTIKYSTSEAFQMYCDKSTGTIFYRFKQSSTWGDWNATGLTTTITNDNGTAIKFPDGTMICRVTAPKENFVTNQTFSQTVQNITIYRSSIFEWTFPVSFVDTNIQINITPQTDINGSRFALGRVNGAFSKTKASIQLLGLEGFLEDEVGYTNLTEVYVTAIGRWK